MGSVTQSYTVRYVNNGYTKIHSNIFLSSAKFDGPRISYCSITFTGKFSFIILNKMRKRFCTNKMEDCLQSLTEADFMYLSGYVHYAVLLS